MGVVLLGVGVIIVIMVMVMLTRGGVMETGGEIAGTRVVVVVGMVAKGSAGRC